MAEIAVIIVNYGTAELAIEAVESVLCRQHGGRTVEVHVVDNASPGDDAKQLTEAALTRGWGDRVTLYPEIVNHGFGRGNNLVFRKLASRRDPPDKVFLLNPDARLANEAINHLANILDKNSDVGMAGARIEKPGEGPVTSAFRFPNAIDQFAQAVCLGPIFWLLKRWRVPLGPHLNTGPVDWVSGASLMIRWEVLQRLGGFDPQYFLYFEEVDMMRSAQAAGWQTWFVAEALVEHHEGAATGVTRGSKKRKAKPNYWYNSWRYYFVKNHGHRYALICLVLWALGAAINFIISAIRTRSPAAPLYLYRDLRRQVFWPLLGIGKVKHD